MYQPGNPQIVHTDLGGDDDACEETTYVRASANMIVQGKPRDQFNWSRAAWKILWAMQELYNIIG